MVEWKNWWRCSSWFIYILYENKIPHDNEEIKKLKSYIAWKKPERQQKWLDHLRHEVNRKVFCTVLVPGTLPRNGLLRICQGNPVLTRFYKVFPHLFCHVFACLERVESIDMRKIYTFLLVLLVENSFIYSSRVFDGPYGRTGTWSKRWWKRPTDFSVHVNSLGVYWSESVSGICDTTKILPVLVRL